MIYRVYILDDVETLSDINNPKNFTKAIAAVIDVIYDQENVYKVSDTSEKEVLEIKLNKNISLNKSLLNKYYYLQDENKK